jgi:uncharacterized protein (TIGR02147 family)
MNIYDFSDYREFLKERLAHKISENPRYSLRAMARDFEMGPSTLSEVFSGKLNLSMASARRLAGKLKMKPKAAAYFYELVSLAAEKDPEVKAQILSRVRTLHPKKHETTQLSVELFKQMAEWYHSAILELPSLKTFEFSTENIARVLKISKPQVEVAVTRLLKLGLLEAQDDGSIRRKENAFRVQSAERSSAMRQYYRQMLSKISDSLDTQTPQERLSGYLNLPIHEDSLPEIDKAIDRFFQDLKEVAAKHEHPNHIYHLSLHFINLTKKDSKK